MKIGNIELKNNVFLAPLAGFTDLPFRLICKEQGAGLVFTEMVSAKGMYYNDEKTHILTTTHENERPVAMQIFGSDPKIMSTIVEEKLNQREDIAIIDINMGCPAPKIVKNNDGCALMRNPNLVEKILKAIVKVSNKPITIKIRKGYDDDNINGVEIAKIAESCGVSGLTIHARTREMFYSGLADWDYIKKVKEELSIPVIGNGDIFRPEDAINMLEHTGCDGLLIGRGSMGNPWIFKRILNLIDGKPDKEPSMEEIIHLCIRHLDMACEYKGERVGINEMRKHISYYLKGLKKSSEIRNLINKENSREKIKEILLEYLSLNRI